MTDFLFLVNSETKIIAVNQAALNLLHYKHNELIGKPIENVISEENNQRAIFMRIGINDLEKIENYTNAETILISKDGKNIPVMITATIIREKNDDIGGYLFLGRDANIVHSTTILLT